MNRRKDGLFCASRHGKERTKAYVSYQEDILERFNDAMDRADVWARARPQDDPELERIKADLRWLQKEAEASILSCQEILTNLELRLFEDLQSMTQERDALVQRVSAMEMRHRHELEQLTFRLSDLVHQCVIRADRVQAIEYGGQRIIAGLFEAISSQPERLLKESFRQEIESESYWEKRRAVCSYIAGMTDSYAGKMYERLFLPKHGSVFEPL